ncbi:MAG: type II secretion system F family protein [Acidobacteriota bacterium]|jgi:type IV pilus assembly protein PilC|nr:type II secretion system F family protein [Acidobacteriota bacterium]
MPIFKYKGKNRVGNVITGERMARSPQELSRALEREQIQVLNIERKRASLKLPFISKKGRQKVTMRELSVFNRQLSVMFNAGLPITQGLGILGEQQKNKYFKEVILDVRRDVEAGANFSNALQKHPRVFNDLYTSMIQAGEASGNLDTILLRLSEYIENITKLVGRVKSAMAYPIAVLTAAVVLTGVILWKVVPTFQGLFTQLGADLPVPTQIVIAASEFLQNNFFIILIAAVGLALALRSYNKTYKGKRVIDRFKLRLPVFGDLLLKTGIARVTRTLSTLLNSGVEIIEAITITAKTAGNAIIEDTIMHSRASVQEGKPIYESWEETKLFPFMVTQMVGVGEQTGSLSNMLEKIADFYDEEVDQAVSALISLMEPIMILFLGGLVGSVVIAMYLPMFAIIGQF